MIKRKINIIKIISNKDINIYGVIFEKTVIELFVLCNHIVIVFWTVYDKFSRNFIVTKIACKFATNDANQTILVSFKRRKSYLSAETKIVQIE